MSNRLIKGLISYLGKGARIRGDIAANVRVLANTPSEATLLRRIATIRGVRSENAKVLKKFRPLISEVRRRALSGRALTAGEADILNRELHSAVNTAERITGSPLNPIFKNDYYTAGKRVSASGMTAPYSASRIFRRGPSDKGDIRHVQDMIPRVKATENAAKQRIDSLRSSLRRYYLTNAGISAGAVGVGGAGVAAYNSMKKD